MVAGAKAVREQPRARGLSVTERRAQEEEEREAEEAAAAKKKKAAAAAKKKVAAAVMAPRTPLPNGVGIQGRGRALSNVSLTNDANSLAALQERKHIWVDGSLRDQDACARVSRGVVLVVGLKPLS